MPEIKETPPKYLQIANHFKGAIKEGEYTAGAELPSIRVLAEEWKVSRPTALKALETLKADGLVTLRQGAGTFVTGRGVSLLKLDEDRHTRVANTGRIYSEDQSAEILFTGIAVPPDDAVHALQLASDNSALMRERLISDKTGPIEHSTTWFDESFSESCPRLMTTERIIEGTEHYVAAQTGQFTARVKEVISARVATNEEARLLDVPAEADQTLLTKAHLTFDQGGDPLSYTLSCSTPGNWLIENSYVV